MGSQIKFYEKNYIDIDNELGAISASDTVATNDGQLGVNFLRNRNNRSGWITNDSDDTAITQLIFNIGDIKPVDTIALIGHNFKEYDIRYIDSFGAFIDLLTETNDAKENTILEFEEIQTSAIYLRIYATQVANEDKRMNQTIITNKFGVGQLEGYPVIKNPRFDKNRKVSNMLSGKLYIAESLGGFSCSLDVESYNSDRDTSLFEDFYETRRSLLVNLSGGDEDQFLFKRNGYLNSNFFLMRPVNNYQPEWDKGVYTTGIKFSMKLEEVVK